MIDETDRKILNMLQENARISNAEIARRVGKAPSAILERIRKLERKRIVRGYEARVNPGDVGLSLTAFIMVNVVEDVGSVDTGTRLASIPGVLEVHYCAGQDSYLVKVRVENTERLAVMLGKIGDIPTTRNTNSTIVLRTVKETSQLPIEE